MQCNGLTLLLNPSTSAQPLHMRYTAHMQGIDMTLNFLIEAHRLT